MTRTFLLTAVTSLALALAASSASAQTTGMHAPQPDRAALGADNDPNMRKSGGGSGGATDPHNQTTTAKEAHGEKKGAPYDFKTNKKI
jgi:hypothetical protein